MRYMTIITLGFILTIANACSNPKPKYQRVTSEKWGPINNLETYHDPIIYEINMEREGFAVGGRMYSRSEIEALLKKLSDLRPKAVLVVTKDEAVSRHDFDEFKIAVDNIFGCTSVICLADS